MWQPSTFSRAFKNAFKEELDGSFESQDANGIASNQGLTLFLDKQTFFRAEKIISSGKEFGTFRIAINDIFSSFSMGTNFIIVKLGYQTTILVTPKQLTSDKSMRALPLAQRQCKFHDEVDPGSEGNLYQFYSQATCEFQCQLAKARKFCGCTPYSYPFLGDEIKICGFYGHHCFYQVGPNYHNFDKF